ncbi:MAG: type I restriction-modification system subunit M N-terminal domain-containing protein [Thermodesulfovibrionales bacterium]
MATNNFREKANFIWSIADLLRGHYKQADYGKVILLPFTVLRRLDSMHMRYIFDELIRKFAELSNETAGEHYTN